MWSETVIEDLKEKKLTHFFEKAKQTVIDTADNFNTHKTKFLFTFFYKVKSMFPVRQKTVLYEKAWQEGSERIRT